MCISWVDLSRTSRSKWFQTFQDISREFISHHNASVTCTCLWTPCNIWYVTLSKRYFEAINCLVRMGTGKNEFLQYPNAPSFASPIPLIPRYVLNLTQQDPLASQPLVQLAVKVLKLPRVTPSSVRVATSYAMHAEYNRSPVKQGATVKGGTRHARNLWSQILL